MQTTNNQQPNERPFERHFEQENERGISRHSERERVKGKAKGSRLKGNANGEGKRNSLQREVEVSRERFDAHKTLLRTIPDPLDALVALKGSAPNAVETYRTLKRAKKSLTKDTRYDHLIEKVKALPIGSLPLRNGLPEPIRRVAALCQLISEALKGKPFPLSQDEVARLFPVCSSPEAGRLLIDVMDEGVLQRVRTGNGARATTWTYIGDDDEESVF